MEAEEEREGEKKVQARNEKNGIHRQRKDPKWSGIEGDRCSENGEHRGTTVDWLSKPGGSAPQPDSEGSHHREVNGTKREYGCGPNEPSKPSHPFHGDTVPKMFYDLLQVPMAAIIERWIERSVSTGASIMS